MNQITNVNYVDFPITSVCRADLESIGFNTSGVDDATMRELAEKLARSVATARQWSEIAGRQ